MSNPDRRRFVASAVAAGAALAHPAVAAAAQPAPGLVHHVFFWLKRPDSAKDRASLIAGLRTLAAIPTVRSLHVGVPASTEPRPVVETSYHVSELLFFDDLAGQSAYQSHPIHLAFVKSCEALWERVIVYDSIAA